MSAQFYYIDIIDDIQEGKGARRLGWPLNGDKPVKYIREAGEVEIKVKGVTAVKPATDILLIDNTPADKKLNRPKGQNLLGWRPTEEERVAMDWVLFDL
jgi:hypothetical protein